MPRSGTDLDTALRQAGDLTIAPTGAARLGCGFQIDFLRALFGFYKNFFCGLYFSLVQLRKRAFCGIEKDSVHSLIVRQSDRSFGMGIISP